MLHRYGKVYATRIRTYPDIAQSVSTQGIHAIALERITWSAIGIEQEFCLSRKFIISIHTRSIHCHQERLGIIRDDGADRYLRYLLQGRRQRESTPTAVIHHADALMEGTQPKLMTSRIIVRGQHIATIYYLLLALRFRLIDISPLRCAHQETLPHKAKMADVGILDDKLALRMNWNNFLIHATCRQSRQQIQSPIHGNPKIAFCICYDFIHHQTASQYIQQVVGQEETIFHLII